MRYTVYKLNEKKNKEKEDEEDKDKENYFKMKSNSIKNVSFNSSNSNKTSHILTSFKIFINFSHICIINTRTHTHKID